MSQWFPVSSLFISFGAKLTFGDFSSRKDVAKQIINTDAFDANEDPDFLPACLDRLAVKTYKGFFFDWMIRVKLMGKAEN